MFGREVDVSFNANVDPYTASLNQATAATQAYSKAADTMLGKVANLGGSLSNALIQKTASLTQANKVATAQAAAYQQKLSSIQTTAKVLGGKTFPELEKTTMGLARKFPVGIEQAVKQIESLQESGVTSTRQIERMSKAYTELGAANRSYGPAIGAQMTELTRTFGNNLGMVSGLGDSLTTLTAKYGGTAQGVLAFSKSLAPIASTVGMNQTQVMGLSTAFSRLGEDGFAAGNAMNKVMLDLNRSVRDGSPEMRSYAEAMNKSVTDLSRQFQSDPTSVLVDFTNAINKKGPNAIRTLESLGIEGVRTVKAITALSSQGNLGEIMSTASESYGSGSTAAAAAEALGGVNDQIARLNDSMSQAVAGAGKPFIGILEGVLKTANRAADATARLTNSKGMQALGFGAQTTGGLASGAMNLVSGASTAAFALTLGRGALHGAQGFQRGRQAAMLANTGAPMVQPPGFFSRLGWEAASLTGATPQPGAIHRMGDALRGTYNVGKNAATMGVLMTASQISTGFGGKGYTTPGGQALKGELAAAAGLAKGGDTAAAVRKAETALRDLGMAAKASGTHFGTFKGAMLNLLTSMTVPTAKFAGKGLGMGMGALATLGMGSPALGAAAAVGGVAYGAYKWNQNQDSAYKQLQDNQDNPFRQFNDFAEKAGLATRSLGALSDAAKAAANAVAKGENPDMDSAMSISQDERSTIRSPEYKQAYSGSGDVEGDAAKLVAMISGSSDESASYGRAVMDYAKQFGEDASVSLADNIKKLVGNPDAQGMQGIPGLGNQQATQGQIIDQNVKAAARQTGFMGRITQGSRDQMEALAGYLRDDWGKASTNEESARKKDASLEQLWGKATKATGAEKNLYSSLIASLSGMKESDVSRLAATSTTKAGGYGNSGNTMTTPMTYDQFIQASGIAGLKTAHADRASGAPLPAYQNTHLDEIRKLDKSYSELTGRTYTLGDSLNAATDAAKRNGTTFDQLTDEQKKGLSKTEMAIGASQNNPEDSAALYKAARMLAEQAMKQSGGSTSGARGALINDWAGSTDESGAQIASAAVSLLPTTRSSIKEQAGKSQLGKWQSAIKAGQDASAMVLPPNATREAVEAQQQTINEGSAAVSEMQSTFEALFKSIRDSAIQMSRSQEQFGISQSRAKRDFGIQRGYARQDFARSTYVANRDFATQQRYAAQDYGVSRQRAGVEFGISQARAAQQYHLTVQRSTRDYNIAMSRMQEEYGLTRKRAIRDNNIQVEREEHSYRKERKRADQDHRKTERRANEEYQRSMRRADEDYRTSVTRANEDFNKSTQRSTADFNKSQLRAGEDFNRTQLRSTEDYQRSMARSQVDFDKSALRANEDYLVSRQRMQADHDRSLRYQIEDSAKALYDPYTRATHKQVWDTKQLLGNMAEQNAMLTKQKNSVAAMKGAGMSQDTVDVLGLADPKNAEQVFRMAAEAMTNPNLIAQLNKTVSERMDLGKSLATSVDNQGFRRSEEEYAVSQARMAEDFTKSQTRATEDFATSVARSAEDFATSMTRATADFGTSTSRAQADQTEMLSRSAVDFTTNMERMAADQKRSVERAAEDHRIGMKQMNEDYAQSMSRMATDHKEAMKWASDDFKKSLKDMAENNAIARKHAAQDQAKAMSDLAENYKISSSQAAEDFNRSMANMADDYARSKGRAAELHATQMADAEYNFNQQMERQEKAFSLSMSDAQTDFNTQQGYMAEDIQRMITDMSSNYDDLASQVLSFVGQLPDDMKGPLQDSINALLETMGTALGEGAPMLTPGGEKVRGSVKDTIETVDGKTLWTKGSAKGLVAEFGKSLTANQSEAVKGADSVRGVTKSAVEYDRGSDRWTTTSAGHLIADFRDQLIADKGEAAKGGSKVKESAQEATTKGKGSKTWGADSGDDIMSDFTAMMEAKRAGAAAKAGEVRDDVHPELYKSGNENIGKSAGNSVMTELAAALHNGKATAMTKANSIVTGLKNKLAFNNDNDSEGKVTWAHGVGSTLGSDFASATGSDTNLEAAKAAGKNLAGKAKEGLSNTKEDGQTWATAHGHFLASNVINAFKSDSELGAAKSAGDEVAKAIADGIREHKIEAELLAKVKVKVSGGGNEDAPVAPGDSGSSNGVSGNNSARHYPVEGESGHRSWARYRDGSWHGGADIGAPKGRHIYSASNGKVIGKRVITPYQSASGSYGRYLVITDGSHDFYYAHMSAYANGLNIGDDVKAGQLIGAVGNSGHTRPVGRGWHLHFEVRPRGAGHGSAVDPNPWLAMGGIATRHTLAHIGEAGPEAVVPLDERGARYMAEMLRRYLDPDDLRSGRLKSHEVTVINNNTSSVDQSTQITGPITVAANDPGELGRQLELAARRSRLVGSRS